MSSGSVSEDDRKPAKWIKDPEKAFGLGFSVSTGGSIFDPKQTGGQFVLDFFPSVSIGLSDDFSEIDFLSSSDMP